jgi:hypothetical protein
MELANRSEVVSKLVRKPLYTMFLEEATDKVYAEDLARSRRPETRRSILRQYLQEPHAYTNKSQFLKTEIEDMLSELPKNPRRQKTADPLKTLIADIKARCPDIPHVNICSKLDKMDIPVPRQWSTSDNRTWRFAFKDKRLKSRMKVYLSKIAPLLAVKTVTSITGNSQSDVNEGSKM